MKVLIVAEYLDNIQAPDTYNSRFLTVADLLVAKGHEVSIVTTDFVHSLKQHINGVNSYKSCPLTALHEPGYPKNVCLKRFYSHYVLSKKLKKWLATVEKPDVIYCAIPSIDFALEAARYADRNGVKFVVDIQDLWPEAFELVVPVVGKLMFMPLKWRVNKVYKTADRIVAVSQTYADRGLQVNKKTNSGVVVFLGTDLKRFDGFKTEPVVVEKGKDEIRLAYVGTLGHSYDLKTVMDAIELLKDKDYYGNLNFLVAGDGPLRKEFEEYAAAKHLPVKFTGMLSYPQMVATLYQCDIAVNPIVKGAAQSIINKHGDYAAAGIPVVSSQESLEYRRLVESWNMGQNCRCGDPAHMAEKLALLIENKALRTEQGRGARSCGENCFDRAYSYGKIIDAIEN